MTERATPSQRHRQHRRRRRLGGDGIRIDGDSAATFNFGTTTIGATSDDGIELAGVNGAVTFSSVTINGSGGDGVVIINATNAVTISGGSIGNTNDPAATRRRHQGGSGDIISRPRSPRRRRATSSRSPAAPAARSTFNGDINASGTASGININANTGGTINFNNQINLSTGANTAVDLTNNAGATINFNSTGNGLDIATTSGVGFNATGPGPLATSGGTVTVTGSGNTINSTSGTALNIVNNTIGANDVTFQSISSNGGTATGIILDTTGSAGGLHVTGTGGAGSGGTIANKTGTDGSNTQGVGIYLNNTADVQLNHMLLNGFGNFAIKASDLNGLGGVATNNAFSLQNSVINGNNGNNSGLDEGAIFHLQQQRRAHNQRVTDQRRPR